MPVSFTNNIKGSKRSFLDFFPTPKFLEMPAPGLAISETGLKLIDFTHTKKGFIVGKFDSLTFTEPLIVAGEIKDKGKLISELTRFRERNDLRYIRVSLPEEKAYLFTTTLDKSELENAHTSIEFMIEENVPLALSESVFDYVIVNSDRDLDEPAKVNVSVVPQSIVEEYLEVLRASGYEPLHFEVESQAIVRSVIPRHDKRVNVILNLSSARVGLYISDGRAIAFTSTATLSNFPKDKRTALSPECMDEILIEMKKIFLYWQNMAERLEEKFRPVEKIILVGNEADRPEVAEFIKNHFDSPIEEADIWQNVFSIENYVPNISREESLSFAVAAGLAMPRHSKI